VADILAETKQKIQWESTSPTFKSLLSTYLVRPFQMLLDPICLLLTIYTSFVYGKRYICPQSNSTLPAVFTFPNTADSRGLFLAILYASLESFALEYGRIRGWGPVVSQLPFLSLLIGCLFAAAANIFNNIYYGKKLVANNFKPVPEARLPPMMAGGFAFSAGLFLFGCKSQYFNFSLAELPRTCMHLDKKKLWRRLA